MNGVETLLGVKSDCLDRFPFTMGVPGKDAALIQIGGFQFVLGPPLLNHCLEPHVEDGRRRVLGELLAAPRHLDPEFPGLAFVLDPSAVHCRNDSLSTQLRGLDREQLTDPTDKLEQAGFAEPNVLIIRGWCRQTFDISVVPTRPFDGHLCRSLGNVVQLLVEALICARHVARRSVRLAVVELPKQQGE